MWHPFNPLSKKDFTMFSLLTGIVVGALLCFPIGFIFGEDHIRKGQK